MKLYHFCSERHLRGIRKTSIKFGVIPWALQGERVKFVKGYQWLTQNPDWSQSWERLNAFGRLPFRRTEYRITVNVPRFAEFNVIPWLGFCSRYHPESETFLNTGTDSQNWSIYRGTIPHEWFGEIDRNPTPLVLTIDD